MRKAYSFAAVVGALALAACVLAPGEVASDKSSTECSSGERFFNGACRSECTSTKDCSGSTSCTVVDTQIGNGQPICLDEHHCAYLGPDTECVGIGTYTTYTRFGMETRPYDSDPYWADPYSITPYDDPYFEESPYGPPYASDLGCRGNARWITVAPTSDPQCAQPHDVIRCRRIGTQCKLLPGTTRDFVAP
jgi:hypothetical protein